MRLPRPVRRRNSIVLTSLVDVMFVLLFFFMLAASAVERRGIGIGMPTSGDGPVAALPLELDLFGPTRWTLGGTSLAPSQLRERLNEAPTGEVLIRTAPGVSVQALTDALTTVRESGRGLRLARLEAS